MNVRAMVFVLALSAPVTATAGIGSSIQPILDSIETVVGIVDTIVDGIWCAIFPCEDDPIDRPPPSSPADCQGMSVQLDNLKSSLRDARRDRENACGGDSSDNSSTGGSSGGSGGSGGNNNGGGLFDPNGGGGGGPIDELWGDGAPIKTDCELQIERVDHLEDDIADLEQTYRERDCNDIDGGFPTSPQD